MTFRPALPELSWARYRLSLQSPGTANATCAASLPRDLKFLISIFFHRLFWLSTPRLKLLASLTSIHTSLGYFYFLDDRLVAPESFNPQNFNKAQVKSGVVNGEIFKIIQFPGFNSSLGTLPDLQRLQAQAHVGI